MSWSWIPFSFVPLWPEKANLLWALWQPIRLRHKSTGFEFQVSNIVDGLWKGASNWFINLWISKQLLKYYTASNWKVLFCKGRTVQLFVYLRFWIQMILVQRIFFLNDSDWQFLAIEIEMIPTENKLGDSYNANIELCHLGFEQIGFSSSRWLKQLENVFGILQ